MPRRVALLYAGIAAVYLLYLPHALPVLDDWTGLELFRQAREGGLGELGKYLRQQIDNTYHFQFRMNWAGILPAFGLSYLAGSTGWPYNLFAWISHLVTALLLYRTVDLLTGDREAGFLAGAVYTVLPPANHIQFWSMSTSFYHLQALGLAWWFYVTWKRCAHETDYGYRWSDLARLGAVLYLGEQIFPALLVLLPATQCLFGRREHHRRFWRFWALHVGAVALLFGVFAFFINRMPLLASFRGRAGGVPWSLWPILPRMLAAAGLPGFAEWHPQWRLDSALAGVTLLAMVCLVAGLRAAAGPAGPRSRNLRLLVWALAGCFLTYLPVTFLALEWRYLYVPSYFVAAGGVAVLSLLGRRTRAVLALLAVAYSVAMAYLEMQQCWVPQSRIARAALEAAATVGPVEAGSAVILSGGPGMIGPAPAFVTGASWALRSVLARSTGIADLEGGRELLVNHSGQFALFRHDSRLPVRAEDLPRLRVFVLDSGGRYQPKSWLAVPAPEGRFRLVGLGGRQASGDTFSREQLRARPDFAEIYFAHPTEGAW
jgi:hypothetical protein